MRGYGGLRGGVMERGDGKDRKYSKCFKISQVEKARRRILGISSPFSNLNH